MRIGLRCAHVHHLSGNHSEAQRRLPQPFVLIVVLDASDAGKLFAESGTDSVLDL